ncbi:MAG: SusC/RagA family TonB-linked outer membrane protein, partial [Tannerella sp.]|nr:SusC/RagA family TonB-linked outer membrane protein [Tannerella sp.]
EVMEDLSKQTGLKFFYSENAVSGKNVTLRFSNVPVNTVLEAITRQTQLRFNRENNTVTLGVQTRDAGVGQQSEPLKITGTVIDAASGEPLIGANIMEKGTANGTVSDIDGAFSLAVKAGATLKISYIGYVEQEIKVSGSAPLRITLQEDARQIDEVVVTALGIKRQEKALGYAVQTVKSEAITTNKSTYLLSSLVGKVAGVKIGVGNEIRNGISFDLRGEGTMFVIDGVPQGDINSLGPEDIESITILKGPTATALYGSGGGNGAVMVTTKRGDRQGLHVSASSSNTFEAGWLAFPTSQSSYSTGNNGKYNPNTNGRWGDRLDIGREALQYDPYTYTWNMQPLVSKGKDNLQNFMVNPWVTNDNVNVVYKDKNVSFRNSLTYIHRQVNWPNNKDDRFSYTIAGDIKAGRFTLDASATVSRYHTPQEFGISGWNIGYFHLLNNGLGAEFDIRDYRQQWVAGQEQITQNWWNSYVDNPYFIANDMTSSRTTNRYFAQATGTYEIASWLKADVRVGADINADEKETRIPWGEVRIQSFYEVGRGRGGSYNGQALLNFDKVFGEFRVEGFGGASMGRSDGDGLYAATTGGLSVPGFYSLRASNGPVQVGYNSMAYWYEEIGAEFKRSSRASQSLFGKAGVSWKNAVFLEATARNDWTSTLSATERSYFYPSVAGSISLTEFLPRISWLDFWKIRGSWTQTKSAPDYYAINQTYSFNNNVWNNMPGASYPGTIRSTTLQPGATRTWETGTAAWFLNSRLKVDLAYYQKVYYNIQVDADISNTSGFEKAKINSQEERLRKGVELTLTGDVIKTRDFTFTSAINLSHYKYIYKKLDPVYSPKDPWIEEGGYINRYTWAKTERYEGEVVHLNGLPVRLNYSKPDEHQDPDLIWGWTNRFQYKNVAFGFQIDGVAGGRYFNRIHSYMWGNGSHPDSDNTYRYDEVVNGLTNYVGEGVKIVSGEAKYDQYGNILEDTRVFAINNVPVSYQQYATAYSNYSEDMKALDWFKLREINIGYALPQALARKLHTERVEVSLVGQNLYLWTKEIWGADPDWGDGLSLSPPTPRQLGFHIKIDF